MLPPAMEGRIEDTVDLNLKHPSVSERYWTKYYFIPKERRRQVVDGEEKGPREDVEGDSGGGGGGGEDVMKRGGGLEKEGKVGVVKDGKEREEQGGEGSEVRGDGGGLKEEKEGIVKRDTGSREKEEGGGSDNITAKGRDAVKNGSETEKMDVDYTSTEADKDDRSPEDDISFSLSSQQEEGGVSGQRKYPDSSGHVCVMVHTNKLCLVTLSPKHPALAPGMEITKVSYNVGKFNRLDNQVSGKGKRGAQMMGPQSPVCIITCADSSQHVVLAGVQGKLVEVNERLVTNPKLLSERPDAEGYLAVILPPLRNGDAPLKRLLTSEQYWGQGR